MKTKITVSQILTSTGISTVKADSICTEYLNGSFDPMNDVISATIIKAHEDNQLEETHDNMIMDLEHVIHQLQNSVKYIRAFTEDDELLITDLK